MLSLKKDAPNTWLQATPAKFSQGQALAKAQSENIELRL
jgi:hypothetical protein